ncbi:MAG TPA: heme o synthase [Tepidisphaeraceae bacterium]
MKPAADITTLSPREVAAEAPSRLADFYELTKPRMNFLVVITTMVGFYMASPGQIDWLRLLHTILGTVMCAASAAVLNQLIEKDHDAKMPRTKNRPLPTGRILPREAAVYGLTLGFFGVVYLALAVNMLTTLLGLATMLIYLLAYTPLKRITSLNTIVGAVPGAIPPLMGFTAVNNALSAEAIAVFGILFFWQLPHFLAIAILYQRDYEAGGFKMLPCVDHEQRLTNLMILLYTVALLPVSLLPTMLGMSGIAYFTAAVLLGLAFFSFGITCATTRQRVDARKLFFASIIYLPLLLAAMMLDKIS